MSILIGYKFILVRVQKLLKIFINNNPNTKSDLIHIDGYHNQDIANQDFYNSLKLASDIIIGMILK